LKAQDLAGKATIADLSMSVYMLDSLQQTQQNSILSWIWLSSDLKGKIESPEYYFENPEEEVQESMDNLMLTQGWRRFRWEDVVKHSAPSFEFIPEYEGHVITGLVTDKKTGLPVENTGTYISVPGQKYLLGGAVSNKNGIVQYNLRNFFGSNEIVVQTASQKDSMNRVEIFSPFSEKFSDIPIPAFNLSETMQQDLINHSIGTQVQNAYLADYLQRFNAPWNPDSTAFYGQPDKKYFLDDYTRFNTMEEVMREYVADVTVHRSQQKFHFRVLNSPHQLFFNEDPLMLMDGVVVFDADKSWLLPCVKKLKSLGENIISDK
jgi:hypothetical protein